MHTEFSNKSPVATGRRDTVVSRLRRWFPVRDRPVGISAFDRGQSDFARDLMEAECPYPPGFAADRWQAGFEQAQGDMAFIQGW